MGQYHTEIRKYLLYFLYRKTIEGAISFRVKSNEYFIPILDKIDVAQEIEKLEKELSYAEGFLKSVRAKLSNEKFVNSAPAQVVENEKKERSRCWLR